MYEAFFGLHERPFAAVPNSAFYFPASVIDQARQNLIRCIDRAEGAALLIGPAGTGKSLLCQLIAEQFRNEYEIAHLASGRICSRRALLQAILFELGLPYRGLEEGELRLSLIDHLSPRDRQTPGLVLIVDEAHTLPLRLMEELRLITNMVRGGQPRVRLLLAGGPVLEERFANPKLESFNQRLAARCYLQAMERAETLEYTCHQIDLAGGNSDKIFTDCALNSIYLASDGIPRLVNQVCDHALLLASANGITLLDKLVIEEAWADLQQLPTPWNSAPGAPLAGGTPTSVNSAYPTIEFGALDDLDSDETDSGSTYSDDDQASTIETGYLEEEDDDFSDEPSALPFRRFVADTTPLDQRIEKIQQELASIDDELSEEFADERFSSSGRSAGQNFRQTRLVLSQTDDTELEETFEESANPFHEEFDEEEIVLDRYSLLEIDLMHNRPVVNSTDGQELSSALAEVSPPAPQLSIADVTDSVSPSTPALETKAASRLDLHATSSQLDENYAADDAEDFTDASSYADDYDDLALVGTFISPEPLIVEEELEEAGSVSELPLGAETTSSSNLNETDSVSSDIAAEASAENTDAAPSRSSSENDDDLILIEDDAHSPISGPTPLVRRQEYRQLFARLRRGS